MAEPTKSVLLVDFDSLHRSLTGGGGEAAARLVMKVPGWLGGFESGRVLGPHGRTFIVKRCYADPKLIGESRKNFIEAGFEMVDSTATSGGRGVDLMMAMDAVEHLAAHEHIDEFILLSGEATLAPLLSRLKAKGRRTAIYSDTNTAQAYRILADEVLDITAFAEFLLTHDAPPDSQALAVERSEIEAFARRIHAATNIPLFSPRTFGELFRLLTEEVIANGYHFQTTAKNVADRLSESGRSVTRRQVVFIVKGLALKGHVFSTTDSPKRLAEVFREQARYLIENAGLTLDEQQDRVLSAWLVDRVPTTVARTPAPPLRPAPPEPAASASSPAPATPLAAPPSPAAASALNGSRQAVDTPIPTAKPTPQSGAKAESRFAPTLKPAERALVDKAVERGAAAAMEKTTVTGPARETPGDRVSGAPGAVSPAAARPESRGPGMISPDDARAAIAAKIAQSVRPKSPTPLRPVPKGPASASSSAPPLAPATVTSAPDRAEGEAEHGEPESIENSILAAIAEAVDVLVEDDGTEGERPAKGANPPQSAASGPKRRSAPAPAQAPARPATESRSNAAAAAPMRPRPETRQEGGEDIGDEIQRIIANYSRNRKDEPEG